MTKEYYSTKRVTAWAETRDHVTGMAIQYADGYQSWCPDVIFARDYRPVTAMTFGQALESLKSGCRVARQGWNGKGMWLSLSGPLGGRSISAGSFWSANNAEYAAAQPGGCANVLPCITMRTADGSILMGWLASQTDMLSEDWFIVE